MRANRSGIRSWAAALLAALIATPAAAQDMLRYLDLKSEEFSKADLSRAEVEAALAAAGPTGVVDLTGRRLNGLDLSDSTCGAANCRPRASTRPSLWAPTSTASCWIRRGRLAPTSPRRRYAGPACLPPSCRTRGSTGRIFPARASLPTSPGRA